MSKRVSGTNEWSVATVNLPQIGCEHGCRYCFSSFNACERFKYAHRRDWRNPVPRVQKSDAKYRKRYPGTVMTPSNHDITEANVGPFIVMLLKLLAAGNKVLVVSKPHRSCIERICRSIRPDARVLFRFTIGARSNKVLGYWEPGAPKFAERKASLKLAGDFGFKTSVSCEPNLCGPKIIDLFHELAPLVSDSIWIGKLNMPEQRVRVETPEDRLMLQKVLDGQTDRRVWEIYDALKAEPKVRWKESIKKVIGLPLATKAGADQ